MISNTDSTLLIYSTEHIRVKAYISGTRQRFQPACGGAPSLLFWAGAIQSAAGPGRFSIEAATREVFLRHTNSRISLDLCAQAGIAAQGAGTSLFGWYSTREKHWANGPIGS